MSDLSATPLVRDLGHSILSVGLIGLLVAKYTPIFDWLGWIFVPFARVTGMAEPVLAGKAVALGIVEVFLPAIQAAEIDSPVTRFVIAVVPVSQIIFVSAMVPCIMATDIPTKIWELAGPGAAALAVSSAAVITATGVRPPAYLIATGRAIMSRMEPREVTALLSSEDTFVNRTGAGPDDPADPTQEAEAADRVVRAAEELQGRFRY